MVDVLVKTPDLEANENKTQTYLTTLMLIGIMTFE
jgi:hypothetical protein